MVPRLLGSPNMKVAVIDSASGIRSAAEFYYLPE